MIKKLNVDFSILPLYDYGRKYLKTIEYARGADASAERKYERISTLEPDTDNAGVGSEPEVYTYLVHPIRGALFF